MQLINVLINASLIVVALVLLIDAILLLLLSRQGKENVIPLFGAGELPRISVLVAARNEEQYLKACLESLVAQDYPANKIEILVGNDRSTDSTRQIAEEVMSRCDRVRLLNIETNLGTAKGKSNVLAQLARQANGEVYLVTDADMRLPSTWCREMVLSFRQGDGIVTGFTVVAPDGFFSRMQAMDWSLALSMVKVITDLGQPVTSMGNNMAVLAKAYFATGGYERLPFSIVEDFQLTRQVLSLGYNIRQLKGAGVTGLTMPAPSYPELLHQRKRWTRGAMQLPVLVLFLLSLQAAYYPAAIFLAVASWQFAWLLVLKAALQALVCRSGLVNARQPFKIASLVLFEFYSAIISLSTLVFSFLPLRIKWKGRYY